MKVTGVFKRVGLLLTLLGFAALSAGGVREKPRVDPNAYPALGKEELGQLRWILKLGDQALEDFSNMEALDQKGMTAYRYCLAFMTYFLAVEQFHKLPAYPELIKPRMNRFIEKMVLRPVWDYWAEVSRGIPFAEPKLNKPYPERHDPVAEWNIMYSGHLGHMIGLYEMLYRDFRWDRPGSIVFEWSEDEKFVYDHNRLEKVMFDQMMKKPHCIPCEPNLCFPECNQHPVLSFMLYDYLHGTLLSEAKERFLEFFLSKKMIHPLTHRAAAAYLVKQDITIHLTHPRLGNPLDLVVAPAGALSLGSLTSASADGWTSAFMHAWQPEFIERHYPHMRKTDLLTIREETAKLKYDVFEPRLPYGFFAILAAEMGDRETRDKLIEFADRKYQPVWEEGTLHYPFNKEKKCTNLTGKLIALARALPPNGLWTLHNRPFDERRFKEPMISEVPFPAALIRRAVYDREGRALVVSYDPGGEKTEKAPMKVINLDPEKTYALFIDGEPAGTYQGKKEITLKLDLSRGHDLVLQEEI